MKLAHYDWETPFSLDNTFVNVLVIEDEKTFYRYCEQLFVFSSDGTGQFVLSEKEKALNAAKVTLFLSDYFNLKLNDKKYLTPLYRELQEAEEENFLSEYVDIQQRICLLLQKLQSFCSYPIDYDLDAGFASLLKAYGVKLSEEADGFLERLLSFLQAVAAFTPVRCVFFVQLKSFLREEELSVLYREAAHLDLSLFLLENREREKIDGEKIRIIDRDLCEILA